ncbi:MAG: hypothetical protein AAGE52_17055 [Myxococcota bacterium]
MAVRMARATVLLLTFLHACGDNDASVGVDVPQADVGQDAADAAPDIMDWPAMRPEASTVPVEGVRREVLTIAGGHSARESDHEH